MKKRLEYINWIRAIATIAVVVLHVASNNWYGYVGSMNWNFFTCYLAATRFSVPIFVMISGVLFLRKEYKLDIKRLYFHNIGRLVIFLVFWHVIYQLYHMIMNNTPINYYSLIEIVKNLLNGQTQVHLWFVYMIIGIYMVCPIFKVFIEHASKEIIEYFLILFFLIGCIPNFLYSFGINSFNIMATNLSKLSITTVNGYIGYFILGYYLETYPLNTKKRRIVYILGLVSLLLTILLTYDKSMECGTYVETYLGYMMPNVFFMSIAVFVYMKNLKLRSVKLIEVISEHSLGIYGIHMLVVFLFWKFGIDTFILPGIISVPMISIAVFIISLVIVWLLKKIPMVGNLIS